MSIELRAILLNMKSALDMKLSELKNLEGADFELVNALCDRSPTTAGEVVQPRIGETPGMRVWNGGKQVHRIMDDAPYRTTIVDIEETIGLNKNDFEDSNVDIKTAWQKRIDSMARDWPRFATERLITRIENGFSTLGPDGQNFFDTDHTFKTNTTNQNNDLGAGGGGSVAAFSATNWYAVKAFMREFKNDRGKEMGVIPDFLLAPPQIEKTVLETFNAGLISTGGTNVAANEQVKFMFSALLSSIEDWFVFHTSPGRKPFNIFMREEPTSVIKNMPTDDNIFFDKEILISLTGRFEIDYANWWTAIGIDVS